MALLKSPYLHGLHEGHEENGLDLYKDKPSWIVFTEAIGYDPYDKSGKDFREWTQQGYWPVVRLNNAYEPGGTIPHKDYFEKFAQRCQNYVAAVQGDVYYYIIGNEPNAVWERPHGWVISPEDYAQCYLPCRAAIKKVRPDVVVMPAPVAVWNMDTGHWMNYFKRVMQLIEGNCDGIALHTYTHGKDSYLVYTDMRMQPPNQEYQFNFLAYRDFLKEVPQSMQSLPVLITESDQDYEWYGGGSNNWIQEAYKEINSWNQKPENQTVQCLAMYRWPKKDKWFMVGKNHVIDDFRKAVLTGYKSSEPRSFKTILPQIKQPLPTPIGKGIVSAGLLNVRSGADIAANLVGSRKMGDELTIYAEKDGWYQIGQDQWVVKNWVERVFEGGSAQNNWQRCLAFILRWEGEWSDHPDDVGGATMKGITIGTYTRWRKNLGQSVPTKDDLRNISDKEVAEIYYEWYYVASGADKMSWPMCLAQSDLAVNGGVGRAEEALEAVGQNFWEYMIWRRDWYRGLEQFPIFGKGWINRCEDLVLTAYR